MGFNAKDAPDKGADEAALLSLAFPFLSCDIGSVGVLRHARVPEGIPAGLRRQAGCEEGEHRRESLASRAGD